MNNMRQINFINLFNERMVIEEKSDYENSVFKPIYDKADALIDNFNESIKKKQNKRKDGEEYRQENLQVVNTISFEGRRGTGKTSAMMSFCNQLNVKKKDGKNKYIVLDYIDASTLEEGESVLEIVLANMYHKFSEHINNTNQSAQNDYDAQNIIRQFEKIYASISFINEHRDKTGRRIDLSPLSGLERLSNSQQLKKEVYKLIDSFIKLIAADDARLVIPIDDIDMCFHSNQSSVYEIMETLHRYLMIPNVVILLTYDYPELLSGCVKHFSQMFYDDSFYGVLSIQGSSYVEINSDLDSHIEEERGIQRRHIRDVANRYLEKVLPTYARIHLPSQRKRDYSEQNNIRISIVEEDIKKYLTIFEQSLLTEDTTINKDNERIVSLNPKEFALLFKASNFGLFYDSQGKKRHYAEPSDFRDMVHIVTMCKQLNKAFKENKEESDEFVFKELLDDLYFRFARVQLITEQMAYKNFNDYLTVNIERRSRDILDDIWKKMKKSRMVDFDEVCSKIEFNKKGKKKVNSYSYGELLYGLYRASDTGVFSKELIWCILDSYTIMLTKLCRAVKRNMKTKALLEKSNDDNYDNQFDEAYKTIKKIIGPSISSSWSNFYVPRLMLFKSGKQNKTGDHSLLKLGAILFASRDNENKLSWKLDLDRDDMDAPLGNKEKKDVLQTIEILCMFFTEVFSKNVNEENLKIDYESSNKYDINDYSGYDINNEEDVRVREIKEKVRVKGEEDTFIKNCFVFQFNRGCFNILNFVVNLFFGEEYFYRLHKVLRSPIRDFLGLEKNGNGIDDWIEENSLYKEFEEWKKGETYKNKEENMTCAMPIYSFDMMYNILKRQYLDMIDLYPEIYDDEVEMDEYLDRLLKVYENLGDALGKQDEFYYQTKKNNNDNIYTFKRKFEECPFIKFMNRLKEKDRNDKVKEYVKSAFNDIARIALMTDMR